MCCLVTGLDQFFFLHFSLVYQVFIFISLRLEKSSILSTLYMRICSFFTFYFFFYSLDIPPLSSLLPSSWRYAWTTFYYWSSCMYGSAFSLMGISQISASSTYCFFAYNSYNKRLTQTLFLNFKLACLTFPTICFESSLIFTYQKLSLYFHWARFLLFLPPASFQTPRLKTWGSSLSPYSPLLFYIHTSSKSQYIWLMTFFFF